MLEEYVSTMCKIYLLLFGVPGVFSSCFWGLIVIFKDI